MSQTVNDPIPTDETPVGEKLPSLSSVLRKHVDVLLQLEEQKQFLSEAISTFAAKFGAETPTFTFEEYERGHINASFSNPESRGPAVMVYKGCLAGDPIRGSKGVELAIEEQIKKLDNYCTVLPTYARVLQEQFEIKLNVKTVRVDDRDDYRIYDVHYVHFFLPEIGITLSLRYEDEDDDD
jgi:hypothetical protein